MLIYADADGKFRVPTRCKIVRFILGRWPEPDAMEIKPVVRVKAGRRVISDEEHFALGSQWTGAELICAVNNRPPVIKNIRPDWDAPIFAPMIQK